MPGFLRAQNRTNVLLTRCRAGMVLVTNRTFLMGAGRDTLIGALAERWEEEGCEWANAVDVLNGRAALPGCVEDGVRAGDVNCDSDL